MDEYLPLFWLVAGVILIVLEFALPSFVVIFFGTSAIAVALLSYPGLVSRVEMQLLLFALLSVGQILLLRRWVRSVFKGEASREESLEFEGQRVEAIADFSKGHGRVSFRGSGWDAICEQPLKQGDEAVITATKGLTLVVSPEPAANAT